MLYMPEPGIYLLSFLPVASVPQYLYMKACPQLAHSICLLLHHVQRLFWE